MALVGAEMLVRELPQRQAKSSKLLLTIIGIVSGVLCGLYGVGALLGAYIGRTTTNADEFKANICTVFMIENTFRIILYGFYGIITLSALRQALTLAPFMLIGLIAGMLSAKIIDEKMVKRIVIIMLIVSGIALILTV